MKPNSNLRFWLGLMEFGKDEEEQRVHWNTYCFWQYRGVIRKLLSDVGYEDYREKLGAHLNPSSDALNEFRRLEGEYGGLPEFQDGPSGSAQRFMDFSGLREFGADVSFAGRILIGADFSGITFRGLADFKKAEFLGRTRFDNASFLGSSRFEGAVFAEEAGFAGTGFKGVVTFNNAKFRSTTSFRKASFGMPPKFFETEIHEDADFSEVAWSDAEESYRPRLLSRDKAEGIKLRCGEAVRAWDRLALMMSRQDKPTERHEFFRLKMRAQRWRDGIWCLSSSANWLFDKSSDYGWGMRRAFCCWAGHLAAGMMILTTAAQACLSCLEIGTLRIAWYGFLVSLSNSLAFLRLGSEGGHLEGPYGALETATSHADWMFSAVGTVQAILGPILLFLVLLTLRNRFRLG